MACAAAETAGRIGADLCIPVNERKPSLHHARYRIAGRKKKGGSRKSRPGFIS